MRAAPSKNVVVEYKKPGWEEDPTEFVPFDFHDEDIQSAVEELAPICDGYRKHSFKWYYDVGKVVRGHYEALAMERTSMYGARFFNRLARELNRPNVDGPLLATCFRLVKNYSEEEYLGYAQLPEVSPTHMLLLAGLQDRKQRKGLIQQVVDEELTTPQLNNAIKEKCGFRHAGNPGRRPKVPKNPVAGLVHIEEQAKKYLKLRNEAWLGERYDIVQEIYDQPADKLTDKFRTQLAAAVEQSATLAVEANEVTEALRDALTDVDRRRAAQAEYNARLEAEEETERRLDEELHAEVQSKREGAPSRAYQSSAHGEIGRASHAI